MTYDELNDDQRTELKQRILEERDDRHPDGPSWGELANAGEIMSDEEAREWAAGMEFSADDFGCSAAPVFRVRVTWPVHKTFQVPAASKKEALEKMRRLVDAGNISCWDLGWEADDGDDVPKFEIEED
jgi:hypothetical protein